MISVKGPSAIRFIRKAPSMLLAVASVILLAILLAGCSAEPTPDPVTRSPQSPALSSTDTAAPTPEPTATPTLTPTLTLTPTPEPGPWDSLLQDPSLPPYVRWEIKQEVDPNEVGAALHGARLIYALGKSLDILDPEGEITVYIDNDTERLAAYYSKLVGWALIKAEESGRRDRPSPGGEV